MRQHPEQSVESMNIKSAANLANLAQRRLVRRQNDDDPPKIRHVFFFPG